MSAPKPPEQLGIKIKEKPKKRKKRKPVKKPHKASKHKSTVAKKKQPLRAEDFIPVKDIRNGIIETTDARYGEIGVGLARGTDSNGLACWYCVQVFLVDGCEVTWVDVPAIG